MTCHFQIITWNINESPPMRTVGPKNKKNFDLDIRHFMRGKLLFVKLDLSSQMLIITYIGTKLLQMCQKIRTQESTNLSIIVGLTVTNMNGCQLNIWFNICFNSQAQQRGISPLVMDVNSTTKSSKMMIAYNFQL